MTNTMTLEMAHTVRGLPVAVKFGSPRFVALSADLAALGYALESVGRARYVAVVTDRKLANAAADAADAVVDAFENG